MATGPGMRPAWWSFVLLLGLGLLACSGGKAPIEYGEGGITPEPDGGRVDSGSPFDGVVGGNDWGPTCEYNVAPSQINWGQVNPREFEDGGVLFLFAVNDTFGSCL